MKKIFTLVTVATMGLSSAAFAGGPKEGAKVQPVDRTGKPTGPATSLPDCRSCKVEKVGPNHYVVKVPQRVRDKVEKKR